MKKNLSRRAFLRIGLTGATGLALYATGAVRASENSARVVVVGGGFAGATAAKYLRRMDPSIEVTLVEPKTRFVTCPGSNWVLAGLRDMESISFGYQDLASRHGVKVVHDYATTVDTDKRMVNLAGGAKLPYDRLIVAPGIDFRFEAIEGYDADAARLMPHAWQAGPQTILLKQQLEAMRDGGTFAIAIPPGPFRCPPGPYERISMVAHYLKQHKPASKILVLDSQPKFSKQTLFEQGWRSLYGYGTDNSLIEHIAAPDGAVRACDTKSRSVLAGDLDTRHTADVINLIPPQKAGAVAQAFGLSDDTGWCPVDHRTWESTLRPGIHVIGDATIAGPMPKSGFAASSQAKICAAAVVSLLDEQPVVDPTWVNTCYSLVGPLYGISVAKVYKLANDGRITGVKDSGGVTANTDRRSLFLEARFARNWYDAITEDTFG